SFTVTAKAVAGASPQRITVTSTGCMPAVTGGGACPSANVQKTVQSVLVFQETLAGAFVALNKLDVDVVDGFDSNAAICQSPPAATPVVVAPAVVYAQAPYCPAGPNISPQGYSKATFVKQYITPSNTNQYSYSESTGAFSMQPNREVTISGAGGNFCFGSMNIRGQMDITNTQTPVIVVVKGTINFQTPHAINNTTYHAEQ